MGAMPDGMAGMEGMEADYGDEDDGMDDGMDPGMAALQQFANNPSFLPLRQRMISNPQFY